MTCFRFVLLNNLELDGVTLSKDEKGAVQNYDISKLGYEIIWSHCDTFITTFLLSIIIKYIYTLKWKLELNYKWNQYLKITKIHNQDGGKKTSMPAL